MAVNINQLPKMLSNPKHSIEGLWASDAGRNSNSGNYPIRTYANKERYRKSYY